MKIASLVLLFMGHQRSATKLEICIGSYQPVMYWKRKGQSGNGRRPCANCKIFIFIVNKMFYSVSM